VKVARRALLALALLASCNRPATQIVLRVDSDLAPGTELQGVFVTLRREGATAPSFEQSYDLTAGALTLPGTLGVVPGDADDARRLEVEARALLPGGDTFSTFATVSFQREQTLFLDLFLASRCRDPQNRAGCGADETCGPNGCEPIVRAMIPAFSADVPRREVSTPEPVDAPDVPPSCDPTLRSGRACIEPFSGQAWRSDAPRLVAPRAVAFGGNRALVSDVGSGRVMAFDLAAGARAWAAPPGSSPRCRCAASGGPL
jgi:hypothetical protein